MTAWAVVIAAGIGTYLLRVSVVAAIDRVRAPAAMERLAGFVIPAAFAGLAASALAGPVGTGGSEGLAVGSAAGVTLVVAARGRAAPVAFAAGLLTLWTVSALITIA